MAVSKWYLSPDYEETLLFVVDKTHDKQSKNKHHHMQMGDRVQASFSAHDVRQKTSGLERSPFKPSLQVCGYFGPFLQTQKASEASKPKNFLKTPPKVGIFFYFVNSSYCKPHVDVEKRSISNTPWHLSSDGACRIVAFVAQPWKQLKLLVHPHKGGTFFHFLAPQIVFWPFLWISSNKGKQTWISSNKGKQTKKCSLTYWLLPPSGPACRTQIFGQILSCGHDKQWEKISI